MLPNRGVLALDETGGDESGIRITHDDPYRDERGPDGRTRAVCGRCQGDRDPWRTDRAHGNPAARPAHSRYQNHLVRRLPVIPFLVLKSIMTITAEISRVWYISRAARTWLEVFTRVCFLGIFDGCLHKYVNNSNDASDASDDDPSFHFSLRLIFRNMDRAL